MKTKVKYELGEILKSKLRTDDYPLFIMVCSDGTISDRVFQDNLQFEGIVLYDATDDFKPGQIVGDWNKDKWVESSFEEISDKVVSQNGHRKVT
jgi:hypothetical protein